MQPVGDLGLSAAMVQRAQLTERHIRTAFTFSLLIGAGVTVLIASAAPAAGALMRSTDVVPVVRILSVTFCIRAISVVADALLQRRLDFRRQFYIDSVSYLVGYGAVGVSLALAKWGVWSLVWGSLIQASLASVWRVCAVRPPMRPLLGEHELKDLLPFGVGATANAIVNSLARNGDNFVVGRWNGPASLGLYSRAYALMNLPHAYGISAMSGVLFPALAQVQREPARVRRGYLLSTQLTALLVAPVMGAMAVAAPHLVPGVYGSHWTGAVVPLQILCVAGYFRALYHLGGIVAHSLGRVYSELWRQVIYAVLVIGGAAIGARYGLVGVAVAVSLAIIYMFVAMGGLALRLTQVSWSTYLRAQFFGLASGLATCVVALAVRLTLEGFAASSMTIAAAVLVTSAIPCGLSILWKLSEPEFESLRRGLPPAWRSRIEHVRKHRHMS
jgi:O-antigen/teichoic acid export membrane protein